MGWILLVLGILTSLLCIELAFVQGAVRFGLLSTALVTLVAGWSLKSYGKGTLQSADRDAPPLRFDSNPPSITPAIAMTPASPDTKSPPTIALPLTASAAAAIRAQTRKSMLGIGIFYVLFLGFLAALLYFTEPSDSLKKPSDTWTEVYFLAGFGLLFGVAIGSIWLMGNWLPSRRNLREGTYLRTSGPIEVVDMGRNYLLRLADQAFPVRIKVAMRLRELNLDWAVVDHTRHGHLILAAWDLGGTKVYCAKGYNSDSPEPRPKFRTP